MSNKQDIAAKTLPYRALIKAEIFSNLHKDLFKHVISYLRQSDSKVLCIVGVGSNLAPYGDKMNILANLGPNLKIIGLDYNPEVLGMAALYTYKRSKDFFITSIQLSSSKEELLNRLKHIKQSEELGIENIIHKSKKNIKKNITASELPNSSITLIENDIRTGFCVADESADCVDATLTLHHTAPYKDALFDVVKGIWSMLKPGGMLYYGTGFADMRYSEAKIKKIAEDVSKLLNTNIAVIDKRDADITYYLNVPKGCTQFDIEYCKEKPKAEHEIVIDNEGLVILPIEKKHVTKFKNMGYNVVIMKLKEDKRAIPLIDSGIEDDEKNFIKPVKQFYDGTRPFIEALEGTDVDKYGIIDQLLRDVDDEMKLALSGRVEYYSSRRFIERLLLEAGFENIKASRPNKDISKPGAEIGGIVAFKPNY
ncbi:hypothetical protein DRJ17_01165 [Candidatus Woesearchaeota archaeon]|nr:MAG: hypothetical protein DRJ17_01165 [Candidatus Woesearchaeota archaeon]